MTYYFTDDTDGDSITFTTNNIVDFYKYYCLATINYFEGYEFCDDDESEILFLNKFMTLVNNKKWKSAYDSLLSYRYAEGFYFINPYEGEIYLVNNESSRVKFPKPKLKSFTKQMLDMQKRIVFK